MALNVMKTFERWWSEHYAATAPLGYCLRENYQDRWLRLHSLPNSKRYAEDDVERAEVRRRAWAAASKLLVTGEPVSLVTGLYQGGEPHELGLSDLTSMSFERVGPYEHPLFDGPFVAYATQTIWPHADFDRLIDAIADDRLQLVWFSSISGEVFAPYDGGIDLIFGSPMRAQSMRPVFPPDWYSQRDDGL